MTEIEPKYQETLDYLYSFVDFSLTRNLTYSPEKFNLDRMRALAEALGNPQNTFPVIHVAGTKGKGSTAAMIASMLMAADYRTGFYISPHLDDFAERIQVNGQPIPHAALIKLVDEIKPLVEKTGKLTTFEITTALAFEAFRRQHVDVAVVEVGLGGRLDSTNIVDPVLSVITSLSMDHMKVLGDTLEQIAAEKAGIIKPGKPVVSSPQLPNALGVLAAKAAETGSDLTVVNRDVDTRITKHSINGQWFVVKTPSSKQLDGEGRQSPFPADFEHGVDFYIPLLGRHQVDNAATAITAVMKLRQQGFEISDKAMQDGLAKVVWPCRFEIISRKPYIVVDSAHNRDSAHKLRQAIQDYFPEKPVTLIFGASEDKDISGMFAELLPICSRVILTRSTHPRAADLDSLIKSAGQYDCPIITTDTIEIALEFSLHPGEPDGVTLAAGSLFVAAAVRSAWFDRLKANES
jgi:dihydrofolate synthase/folylpolyglutamate synthase